MTYVPVLDDDNFASFSPNEVTATSVSNRSKQKCTQLSMPRVKTVDPKVR